MQVVVLCGIQGAVRRVEVAQDTVSPSAPLPAMLATGRPAAASFEPA